MAISPELQQFKSSGVYRLEFDKSQTVNVPQETIRLVVGHSRKGPYNTPVFIENTEQFIDAFGPVDKNLERRGMYFHRSALETLSRGPILAVNLFKSTYSQEEVPEEMDRSNFVSIVTNGSEQGLHSVASDAGYSKFFDTERFWKPTEEKLLKVANDYYTSQALDSDLESSNRALNFVNIKQDPITIIVRQARDVRGFEIIAREWYGEGNVPDGINPFDYISEYMVDVIVFKGHFDAATLNNDPIYGAYFDEDGLIKDKVSEFAGRREVTVLASYTGSLIPDFIDQEGRQMYIKTLINIETRRTGLYCAVNEDAVASMDLVGDSFDVYQDYEVLSHIIKQRILTDSLGAVSSTQADITGALVRVVEAVGSSPEEVYLYGGDYTQEIDDTDFLLSNVSNTEYTDIVVVEYNSTINATVITTGGFAVSSAIENFSAGTAMSWASDTNANITVTDNQVFLNAVQSFAVGNANGNYIILNGGFSNGTVSGNIYHVDNVATSDNGDGTFDVTLTLDQNVNFDDSTYLEGADLADLTSFDVLTTNSNTLDLYQIELNSRGVLFPTDWEFEPVGAGVSSFTKTVISGSATPDFGNIKVGMYMSNQSDGGSTAKILQISRSVQENIARTDENGDPVTDGNGNQIFDDVHTVTIRTHRNVEEAPKFALYSFDEATTSYKTFPIQGSVIQDKKIANILDVLVPGSDKGFANTLVDKDAITFRYLVDTFGSLEDNKILNKSEFTKLAAERQNASAILNAPMVKELRECTNPSFVDSNDVFKTSFIADGGNLDKNPTDLYELPTVAEGANYGFYYGPGLTVIENGRTLTIPPAAYISNNYIDKYTNALPWSIIAGPRRGVVSGTNVQGLEYSFDKLDRDVVEPFGINPIVFERGVGLVIKGNKTAQQKITSALSSAHVREALIYIEDGLAQILQNYLFEFNTAQSRLEIKTLADAFMESIKKDGGVYDYRNIMDTTNNTNEVIDANIGVLDTYVEPVKGLEILVSRVTVLNTGEIASGNFS